MVSLSDGCVVPAEDIAEISVADGCRYLILRMRDGASHCHEPTAGESIPELLSRLLASISAARREMAVKHVTFAPTGGRTLTMVRGTACD